jgi:ATP-binding cassette subfamily B protein
MSFHLKRETGKVIRIVSRGSVSFANILRFSLFNIVPTFLELGLVLLILGYLYKYYFFVITGFFVLTYIIVTFAITEWRAKYFKQMN